MGGGACCQLSEGNTIVWEKPNSKASTCWRLQTSTSVSTVCTRIFNTSPTPTMKMMMIMKKEVKKRMMMKMIIMMKTMTMMISKDDEEEFFTFGSSSFTKRDFLGYSDVNLMTRQTLMRHGKNGVRKTPDVWQLSLQKSLWIQWRVTVTHSLIGNNERTHLFFIIAGRIGWVWGSTKNS